MCNVKNLFDFKIHAHESTIENFKTMLTAFFTASLWIFRVYINMLTHDQYGKMLGYFTDVAGCQASTSKFIYQTCMEVNYIQTEKDHENQTQNL